MSDRIGVREYIGRMLSPLQRATRRESTIDTITFDASALSPRKPIDLTDEQAVTEVLDLATKVGSVELDSGTGAVDTSTQVRFVAAMYGITDVDVDVTFSTISASARRGTRPPITTMRTVAYRSLDFTRLAQIDRLIRRIRNRAIDPSEAHAVVDLIVAAPHPYPRWLATIAWGVMAAAIGISIGGSWLVAITAFVSTVVTDRVNRGLNKRGVPLFYQQVVGGAIAVIPAALLYNVARDLHLSIAPSLVIASGVVVLLSGQSLVGSVQDAITGAPVTGVARFFELLLMTSGIIAGVGIALRVCSSAGIHLPAITSATSFAPADSTARVAAGGVAALAFAVACYSEVRALPVAFLAGAIGVAIIVVLQDYLSVGAVIAAGVAASIVGLVGGLLARQALTPPLVVAAAGITPLLPGLAIYRGLYGLLNDQTLEGFTQIASAIAIAGALAAGVTLGELIARTLRRPKLATGRPPVIFTARSLRELRKVAGHRVAAKVVPSRPRRTTVDPTAPTVPMAMRPTSPTRPATPRRNQPPRRVDSGRQDTTNSGHPPAEPDSPDPSPPPRRTTSHVRTHASEDERQDRNP
ncbi:threonine/serine exporter family protein [Gordonia jinhuaensis]|uniref:Amino acid export carrier protein n=1 Tax=Gordonia jinhuaensis TaxID=1517702 RepID=A0A916SX96_9ACTN|nr:hypothetical protein GCM10011489_06330 [Gordonia jinhuaensis]